mgnify:CR=1 FL=1
MSKVSIFNQEWIDLVFEGRNKEYGAYQLRRDSSKTTIMALISGIGLVVALICLPVAINYFNPPEPIVSDNSKTDDNLLDDILVIHEVKPIPKPPVAENNPAPTTQPATPAPNTEPTRRFVPLVVTSDRPDSDPPTIDDLDHANPGNVDNEGSDEPGFNIGTPAPTPGTGSGSATGTGEGEAISNYSVDISPEFPGGLEKFYKRVGNEFKAPSSDREMTLKVYVSFVIETDGTLTNIKVLRDPGYEMGKEAIRVLKSIKTKWKPGIKDGKKVRTAYNLPITVNLN